jgi:hypothetical protein
MKSARISSIALRVMRTFEAPDLCATFQVEGAPAKWVQFGDGKINAAYPLEKNPQALVATLGGHVESWDAGKFLTVTLPAKDAESIARWIDTYLRWVLQSQPEDAMALRLAPFRPCLQPA